MRNGRGPDYPFTAGVFVLLSLSAICMVNLGREDVCGEFEPEILPKGLNCHGPYQSCRSGAYYPQLPSNLAELETVLVLKSGRRRPRHSITLVTQTSLDRLERLENMCSIWTDIIAASVYFFVVDGHIMDMEKMQITGDVVAKVSAQLKAVHGVAEQQVRCLLDVALYVERAMSPEHAGLYPINALRNRALALSQSEIVLLLDVDFLPSTTILSDFHSWAGFHQTMELLTDKKALVVPAFEPSNKEGGEALVTRIIGGGKQQVAEAIHDHEMRPFAFTEHIGGQGYTNHSRWLASGLPYELPFIPQLYYEPFIVVHRKFLPWYDERFRGYGMNKIVHITALHGLGITFWTHPTGYVAHVPHGASQAKKHAHVLENGKLRNGATKKNKEHMNKVAKLYDAILEQIDKHSFHPVTSFA